jgi:hypothetical protein
MHKGNPGILNSATHAEQQKGCCLLRNNTLECRRLSVGNYVLSCYQA